MCKSSNFTMPKFHKQLNFNAKVLQQLITTENSCVEVVKKNKHITLFPYHLNNIKLSIKEILNESIARYNSDLEGILLGYKNIKLLNDIGLLNDDSCFIHLDIQADFYVFKPVVGNELPAIVTKKSKDHVGCLVYHMFNVSLPKPEGIENWTGSDVEIGQEIIVRITFSNLDEKLPYIRGEFLNNISEYADTTESSNNKRIVFNDLDEETPKVKEKKKKKHKEAVQDSEQDISELQDNSTKKKRKSKKSDPEIINGVAGDTEQNESIVKKKRKISELQDEDQTNGDEEHSRKKKKKSK